MSRRPYRWEDAVVHLQARCERMAAFIDGFGKRRMPVRRGGSLFAALSSSIAYQQLSGKAAATIYGRFLDLFPDRVARPEATAAMPLETLRAVGLSQNKALSILDLARHANEGLLPSPWRMARMSNGEIVDALCQVRGIGPWTVQMYLMFNLGRPDVMPATDLGIQKGMQILYRMRELPDPDKVLARTRRFAPFRSVASWYFWRATEN